VVGDGEQPAVEALDRRLAVVAAARQLSHPGGRLRVQRLVRRHVHAVTLDRPDGSVDGVTGRRGPPPVQSSQHVPARLRDDHLDDDQHGPI
jgi:hypothetical protein